MDFISKKEADAYDRIMDAAAELFDLIEQSEIPIGDDDLETLTTYLAQNAVAVKGILRKIKTPKGGASPSTSGPRPAVHDEADDPETD